MIFVILDGDFATLKITETDDDHNYKDFTENVLYPHYMGKSNNFSFFSTSILGKLHDISREIVKNVPLPSFSIPDIQRNSVKYSKKKYNGNSTTENVNCCLNEDRDDNRNEEQDEVEEDGEEGEGDIFGCDELLYIDATDSEQEQEENCKAICPTYTHNIPSSSSSSSLSYLLPDLTNQHSSTLSLATQSTPHLPLPLPVPLPIPVPLLVPVLALISPLHALALSSISMDPDLQAIRSQDFLEISMRIYKRYKIF